ncbi:hypothetical protein Tco_1193282, partial [Tanacetum coccineum]
RRESKKLIAVCMDYTWRIEGKGKKVVLTLWYIGNKSGVIGLDGAGTTLNLSLQQLTTLYSLGKDNRKEIIKVPLKRKGGEQFWGRWEDGAEGRGGDGEELEGGGGGGFCGGVWFKGMIEVFRMEVDVMEFDKTCKTRITPTGVTEGERGFEQTKRCYLTEVIPFFKTLKEHFIGVQTALFKEVKEMEEIFDQMNNEVDKNTVDKQCAEIEKKNLLIENENLIVNCLSTQLLYDVEKSRCLDLEADMSKVHDESKLISKLEREYLNLQLKYQHLQESFDNKNSQASQEAPDFNSFFKIKNLEHQIQEKDNVIRNLKVLVANVNDRSCEPYNAKDVTALIEQNDCVRIELEKVKQHYKELYDSIKITRAHTSEKTSTMLNEIESLKAQLRSKEPCFTSGLCPNQKLHALACVEMSPKSFNERDNKAPSTPVPRKKQVTFSDKPGTSSSNTQEHKVHQRVQLTNIPVLPSTGVNDSTEASGSYRSCFGIWTQACSKTTTGKSSKLMNFVEKFIGQFCDSDLEVAFRKHTCFVRDINGSIISSKGIIRAQFVHDIEIDNDEVFLRILAVQTSKSKSLLWHRPFKPF